MVDEAGCVSAHGGVNDVSAVNAEHVASDTLQNTCIKSVQHEISSK